MVRCNVKEKKIAVPMPEVTVEPQAPDYVVVHSVTKGLHTEYMAQELWDACLMSALASATPEATKRQVFTRAQSDLKAILDQGERFVAHLYAALVREGLGAMAYSSKPFQVRSFRKVYTDFAEWWLAHPEMHNSHILAEYL